MLDTQDLVLTPPQAQDIRLALGYLRVCKLANRAGAQIKVEQAMRLLEPLVKDVPLSDWEIERVAFADRD